MQFLPQTGLNKEEALKGKKANPALMVPCFQLKNTDHEGWMNKLGGSGLTPKNWRRRWFVLQGKKLYYYKTSFVSCRLTQYNYVLCLSCVLGILSFHFLSS